MSARILVVDDLAPNRHLLEAKLRGEYYDVLSAASGQQALDIAARESLDLVLLDAIMPGINGFEVCKRLKGDPKTWHIPVVMVTALEETSDRIRGLEAGADDFISKPIDDFNMMARVRSLLRLKMITDQLLSHTGQSLEDSRPMIEGIESANGKILIVDDHMGRMERMAAQLVPRHNVTLQMDPRQAIVDSRSGIDLLIVSLVSDKFDGLRLCARLRSDEKTRNLPILAIGEASEEARMVRAYDVGINDTLMRPVETQELLARVATQLKRKFYADSLRDNFNENLEMVVSDPLTGLGNRRYFDRSIMPLLDQAKSGDVFSLVMFDVDHFKRVNDILGHDTGDTILKEIAARLVTNFRSIDIVSRYGGEEFVAAMPDTNAQAAKIAADRIRALISGTPIYLDGQALSVSVSAGISQSVPGESARDMFKRADEALYKAKLGGRDRVETAPIKKAA